MIVIPPTQRQKEIEDSFRCKKPMKRQKKHYLKADAIKAELLKRGKSLSDLAKRVGISVNAMYNRAQGVKDADVKEIKKICRYLGMKRSQVAELR